MIHIHYLPCVVMLINDILSRNVFVPTHVWKLTGFGVFYNFVNFVATKYRGTPLYHFLTWEDWTSLLVAGGTTLLSITLYLTICYIQKITKGKPLDNPIKNKKSMKTC